MNHSDKDSDWLIVKCFISAQSTLTTLLFALEKKFVLKIEKNVLLSCSSRFLRALQQNRAQARLFYLLFIISFSLEKGNVKINSNLQFDARLEKQTKAFIHLKSCAAIQQEWPQAESGYYWITIGSREVQVYCDMTNYGKPQVK